MLYRAENEDEMKIEFIKDAVRRTDFFAQRVEVDEDVHKAIDWIASRSADQVRVSTGLAAFATYCIAGQY